MTVHTTWARTCAKRCRSFMACDR